MQRIDTYGHAPAGARAECARADDREPAPLAPHVVVDSDRPLDGQLDALAVILRP